MLKTQSKNELKRRPGESLREQIDRVREAKRKAEAAAMLKRFVGMS